jgi:hypothetical protein
MQCPLPTEHGFDKYNNFYNLTEVKRIGDEYGVSTNWYDYKNYWLLDKVGMPSTGYQYRHNNWSQWIARSSIGFTKQGIEKICESIRAYTYLILSSQFAARHDIIGDSGPAIAAQRIFYDNLEDVINKAVSIQEDVSRYQSVLKYARSSLDYNVGANLYMLPSDMRLGKLDRVYDGYNDKLIVSSTAVLGIKEVKIPQKIPQKVSQKQISQKEVKIPPKIPQTIPEKIPQETPSTPRHEHVHEEEKHGLIMGFAGVLLFAFWFFK